MGAALRTLDRSKPYGSVMGMSGAAFEQNGILFTLQGFEARAEDLQEIGSEEPPPSSNQNEEQKETPAIKEEIAPIPEEPPTMLKIAENQAQPDTLEKMHYMRIKAMVESYGGKWTNKEEGIDFLRGRKPA